EVRSGAALRSDIRLHRLPRRLRADPVESLDGVERRRPALAGEAVERCTRPVGLRRALGRVRVPPDRLGSELLMPALSLTVSVEKLRLAEPFRISGYVFEAQDAVVVTLDDGAHRGRGEASGVYYLGDDALKMVAVIEGARSAIE